MHPRMSTFLSKQSELQSVKLEVSLWFSNQNKIISAFACDCYDRNSFIKRNIFFFSILLVSLCYDIRPIAKFQNFVMWNVVWHWHSCIVQFCVTYFKCSLFFTYFWDSRRDITTSCSITACVSSATSSWQGRIRLPNYSVASTNDNILPILNLQAVCFFKCLLTLRGWVPLYFHKLLLPHCVPGDVN